MLAALMDGLAQQQLSFTITFSVVLLIFLAGVLLIFLEKGTVARLIGLALILLAVYVFIVSQGITPHF